MSSFEFLMLHKKFSISSNKSESNRSKVHKSVNRDIMNALIPKSAQSKGQRGKTPDISDQSNYKFKRKGHWLLDDDLPSPILELDSPNYEKELEIASKNKTKIEKFTFNKIVRVCCCF